MREACVVNDEAESFNVFAKILKRNKLFFEAMRDKKCGLITKEESALSNDVTQE